MEEMGPEVKVEGPEDTVVTGPLLMKDVEAGPEKDVDAGPVKEEVMTGPLVNPLVRPEMRGDELTKEGPAWPGKEEVSRGRRPKAPEPASWTATLSPLMRPWPKVVWPLGCRKVVWPLTRARAESTERSEM